MVTLTFSGNINIYRGLSTDIKPPAVNGSIFFEMDTGNYFVFALDYWSYSEDVDGGIIDEWNYGDELDGGTFWEDVDDFDGGFTGADSFLPISSSTEIIDEESMDLIRLEERV